jgi:hypothetical protein
MSCGPSERSAAITCRDVVTEMSSVAASSLFMVWAAILTRHGPVRRFIRLQNCNRNRNQSHKLLAKFKQTRRGAFSAFCPEGGKSRQAALRKKKPRRPRKKRRRMRYTGRETFWAKKSVVRELGYWPLGTIRK